MSAYRPGYARRFVLSAGCRGGDLPRPVVRLSCGSAPPPFPGVPSALVCDSVSAMGLRCEKI